MRGLDPRIHVLLEQSKLVVDGRDKPGHDNQFNVPSGAA